MPRYDPDEEVTGGEAARLLELSRQQVNRLAHAGKLLGRQIAGRYWLFRKGDVFAYKRAARAKGGRPKSGPATSTPAALMGI